MSILCPFARKANYGDLGFPIQRGTADPHPSDASRHRGTSCRFAPSPRKDRASQAGDCRPQGRPRRGKPERSVPDFVKQNTRPQADPSKPRKKRTQNFTFHRLPPTTQVEHACTACPDCGHKLSGGWEASRRQVVEIPPVAAEVIDHITVARRCGSRTAS